jgi:hypothetical protein
MWQSPCEPSRPARCPVAYASTVPRVAECLILTRDAARAVLLPSTASASVGHCDTKITVRTGASRMYDGRGELEDIGTNTKTGPDEPWWCRRAARGLLKLVASAEAVVMGCIHRVRCPAACAAKHCLRQLLASGDSLRTEIRWRRALRPLTFGVRCRAIARSTPERRSVRNSSGPCTYTSTTVTVCQYLNFLNA